MKYTLEQFAKTVPDRPGPFCYRSDRQPEWSPLRPFGIDAKFDRMDVRTATQMCVTFLGDGTALQLTHVDTVSDSPDGLVFACRDFSSCPDGRKFVVKIST